ncbi:hypothetical protein ABQE23_19920 [Enterococcus avium]|uniref:hypothetical protein n=1 Tax=Enterococcus avium TaxID=33945 RepID=UPI0032E3F1C1
MSLIEIRALALETLEKIDGDTLNTKNAPEFFSHFTDSDYDQIVLLKTVFKDDFIVRTIKGIKTLDKIAIKRKYK